jgi:YCII-related domain
MVVIYGPPAENEAERLAGMEMMGAWYRALGTALVDPGAPFTAVRAVSERGIEKEAIGPNASGYTMIQAESLDEAAELVKGCPLLPHGRRINVFETFAM